MQQVSEPHYSTVQTASAANPLDVLILINEKIMNEAAVYCLIYQNLQWCPFSNDKEKSPEQFTVESKQILGNLEIVTFVYQG